MTAENQYTMPENTDVHFASIDRTVVDALPPVFIFSVRPEPTIVAKGGLGQFVIPGRGKHRVSEPLTIKGMHPEHMVLGGPIRPVNYIPGKQLAEDIVGINSADRGLGRHTSNLEWYGVFISQNNPPKDHEIQAAEEKRTQYLQRVVADADAKFMQGKQAEIDSVERAAAHELRLKKQWAEKPTAMDACEACGMSVLPGVAVCPHCNAVLNEEKARKFFPERFAKPEQAASSQTSQTNKR